MVYLIGGLVYLLGFAASYYAFYYLRDWDNDDAQMMSVLGPIAAFVIYTIIAIENRDKVAGLLSRHFTSEGKHRKKMEALARETEYSLAQERLFQIQQRGLQQLGDGERKEFDKKLKAHAHMEDHVQS